MEEFVQRSEVQWAVVAFLLGTVFGLVILGWWLWPVEWTDALLSDLAPSPKETYVEAVAEAYAFTGNEGEARRRLAGLDPQTVARMIAGLEEQRLAEDKPVEAQQLRKLAAVLDLPNVSGQLAPTPAGGLFAVQDGRSAQIGLIVVLLVAAGSLGLVVWRRQTSQAAKERIPGEEDLRRPAPFSEEEKETQWRRPRQRPTGREAASLKSFTAAYVLGDEEYEESFYIEDSSGDLLGECGMRASMGIGTGTPTKVSAFEVWLFDKAELRTTTNVLASEYAYNDPDLQSQLFVKGDVVLVEEGQVVALETQNLEMEVEILEMEYTDEEEAEGLPGSYFKDLAVHLRPRRKRE